LSWFNSFDQVGRVILGTDAKELAEAAEKNNPKFIQTFADAQLKTYKFLIKAKTETYSDATKLRCTVLQVESLDYVQESDWLIKKIQQYAM